MSDTIDCPKCNYAHAPTGMYDDDDGLRECDSCGFMFITDIDYDPSYSTRCATHEYGEPRTVDHHGTPVKVQFCIHCMQCLIVE